MRTDNKPLRVVIREAAEEIVSEGKSPFTRKDIIQRLNEKYERVNAGSINPIIQGMTYGLKGGAPGSTTKDVFRTVGKGLFELIKADEITDREMRVSENSSEATGEGSKYKLDDRFSSESEVQNWLFSFWRELLSRSYRIKTIDENRFEFEVNGSRIELIKEGSQSYYLPGGVQLTHKSDILIINHGNKKKSSIEIKFHSAVSDQFKARSYDMIHLKNTFGKDLHGVLIYFKSSMGISIDQAMKIAYPFDLFVDVTDDNVLYESMLEDVLGEDIMERILK